MNWLEGKECIAPQKCVQALPGTPRGLAPTGHTLEGSLFCRQMPSLWTCSAPFLFNMVADAIQWILKNHCHVQHSFHYLDDYFFAGPSNSQACGKSLSSMLSLCDTLNIPLKPEKMVGPTTSLTFLGVELDTTYMTARLTQDKLTALLSELHHFAAIYQPNQVLLQAGPSFSDWKACLCL